VNPIARATVPVATRAPTGTTHAYVVGSDPAVLVDPANRTDELDRLVEDRSVEAVAVTHTHPDHVDGVVDYADGRTVWAHADHRGRFADATGVEPDRTFGDGDRLPGGLEVLATPGHAVDHVAFARGSASEESAGGDGSSAGENPRGESILVGDLAVAEGSVVVGHPSGDVRAYVSSLRRLWARDPARLHPAHGPTIEDPRETCRRLIDHRRDREERVLRAVVDGAETLPEITDAAYEKDLSGVRDLAEATVRAHVEKLRVEGRISWENGRARAVLP